VTEARIKRIKSAPGRDPGWYFVVVADNGEPVATSEPYTRPEDAVRGVADLRAALADPAFTIERVDDG
jgi:uncharacterized protein YegP (UPF0339 family)